MSIIGRIASGSICAALCIAAAVSAAGEKKAYPQGLSFNGCLKPSVGQDAMDAATKSFYDNVYSSYIVGPTSGSYYIDQNGDGITTSEAHGYGMMVMALMAGPNGEPNAQAIFDGMLKFSIDHPSNVDDRMMDWAPTSVNPGSSSNCATDGDLDIAYALILADRQWGSDGAYDYIDSAKVRITAIIESIFDPSTDRITTDDWQNEPDYATRSSDWLIDHIRVFKAIDPANTATCDAVITEVYRCIDAVADGNTGLVSDFVTGSNPAPDPNAAGTGEPDGEFYSYNGCRFPWRIAMDYMHFGTATAKASALKIADWAHGISSTFAITDGGYTLDGQERKPNYGTADATFIAPLAVAASISGDQAMTDDGWTGVDEASADNVYAAGLKMLSMLAISGNWWNPVADNTPVLNAPAELRNYGLVSSAARTVQVSLPTAGQYRLSLFGLDGRMVKDVSKPFSAGISAVDASDISSGVYIATISGAAASFSGRVILGN